MICVFVSHVALNTLCCTILHTSISADGVRQIITIYALIHYTDVYSNAIVGK